MKTKKKKQSRKGFSLVELLIAVVVLGILAAMVLTAGTASQNRARVGVAQNDLDGMKNATYQAMMANPKFMKYTDGQTSIRQIVDAINLELDDAWKFTMVSETEGSAVEVSKSGGVAYTATQRDPWGSPYSLYIYTDDCTTTYGYYPANETTPALLSKSDSLLTIVIASAGRNGTGVGLGMDGDNGDPNDNNSLKSAELMVNNTDGIDDMGVIIRNLNGQLFTASFGYDTATLGLLESKQWVFGCKPSGDSLGISGMYADYSSKPAKKVTTVPTISASIDVFSTKDSMLGDAINSYGGGFINLTAAADSDS